MTDGPRGLTRVMLNDEADWRLLSLANEKGKFAIPFGLAPAPELQAALERGIDREWFTLVDVGTVSALPGVLMRVFRLTRSGRERLADLKQEFSSEG